LIVLYNCMT